MSTRQRVSRWRRSCGFDHNDLRRSVDRTQWMLGIVLLIAYLAVAPLVSAVAIGSAYEAGVRAEHHEAATFHRVHATVTKVTYRIGTYHVTVDWTAADGKRHTGDYSTARGTIVGRHPKVWADTKHVSDEPPQKHAGTVGDTAAVAALAPLAMSLPFLGAYALLRHRYDQRRYQLWEDEWAQYDDQHSNS
ncbi:MAG TPA: hypothetical protein VFV01_00990 [Spirillospora sp.]|nr:hypothetical protein [Spirillospora sp.]